MIDINFAHTHSALARAQRAVDRIRVGIAPSILLTILACAASIVVGTIYLLGTQHALAAIKSKQAAQAPIVARLQREQQQLNAAIKAALETDAAERANGTIAYALATELSRMPQHANISSLTADKTGTTSIAGNARSSAESFAIASLLSPGATISISQCKGLCTQGGRRTYSVTNPSATPTPAPAAPLPPASAPAAVAPSTNP